MPLSGWKMTTEQMEKALMCVGAAVLTGIAAWHTFGMGSWCWTGQAAAAWIQAIGSILAILGTAGAVLWQHRLELSKERRARLEAELALMEKIHGIASRAAEILRAPASREDRESLDDYFKSYYKVAPLASIHQALQAIPVLDMPNDTLMLALQKIKDTYRTGYEQVKSLSTDRNEWDPHRSQLQQRISDIEGDLLTFTRHSDKLTAAIKSL